MKTPFHTIANSEDLYSDEPILDECFDINYLYGKSYDSWVHNKLGEDKHDSTSTSPPFKTDEEEEFCFDGALDDDPFLLDDPPCETIVSHIYMGG
jgi:hypothetical protein